MQSSSFHPQASAAPLGKDALFGMAAAAGLAVANIYYNQPMLGLISAEFHRQGGAGPVSTATQLGYALGLFFLVPLGDMLPRRWLIIGQFVALSLALALTAVAPSPLLLSLSSLLVGAMATVAQQIVPLAASLSSPERRGATVGTVMAGLLSGILFSRTLAGFVASHAGWREMFWLGVPLALFGAVLMVLVLPEDEERTGPRSRYAAIMRSLVDLWRRERDLRVATLVQASLFASFTVFWTVLAFRLQAFGLGAETAGLFGVVGAVGILAAPVAGRLADRHGAHPAIWLGAAATLAAWVLFGVWVGLAALVVGVVILDFGIQGALVSHQQQIFTLDPAARSRINTLFMTGMFLGGAAGSASAIQVWTAWGWEGTCLLGGGFALLGLLLKRRK
ncbi:MFS transporter [Niveispirillum sp.]|uniref:MFS transporter n=1 Tax=Niveispirillum sp. TaxID=1917217 RepID=UPI0025EFEFBF|nr:MFS transporter [Niveispirillum sp.]